MFNHKKEIFSIRKTCLGVGSVLLGTLLYSTLLTETVKADEKPFELNSGKLELVSKDLTDDTLELSTLLKEDTTLYLASNSTYPQGHLDYIKLSPNDDDKKRGYDYINIEWNSRRYNGVTTVSKENVDSSQFNDKDVVIFGDSIELERTETKIDKGNYDDYILPYIYFPKKTIVWNLRAPELEKRIYNFGIASRTEDGRIGTELGFVFTDKSQLDIKPFYNHLYKGESDHHFNGWGDVLTSVKPFIGASVVKRLTYAPKNILHLKPDDFPVPNYKFVIPLNVVWKDGKEPEPLDVGENITKEYRIYEFESNRLIRDWTKVTFVGDTRQYDKLDDIRELDPIDTAKFKTGSATREIEFHDDIPKEDGVKYRYFNERKKQGFVTNKENLLNYDGYSWDLVPSFMYNGEGANDLLLVSGVNLIAPRTNSIKNTLDVYRVVKSGSVVVNYESMDGEVIKKSETIKTNQPLGTSYNIGTDALTPKTIEHDGKNYYFKRLKEGSAPSNGTIEGSKTNITYVYELPKEVVTYEQGKVVVKYVDESGNRIKDDVENTPLTRFRKTTEKVLSNGVVVNQSSDDLGVSWSLSTINKPDSFEKDGFTYKFKEVKDNVPTQGVLQRGTKEITLVYTKQKVTENKGPLKLRWETVTGEKLREETIVSSDVLVSKTVETFKEDGTSQIDTTDFTPDYDVSDQKERLIKKGEQEFWLLGLKDDSVPLTGQLKAGDNIVTFVYTPILTEDKTVREKGTVKVEFYEKGSQTSLAPSQEIVSKSEVMSRRIIRKYFITKSGEEETLDTQKINQATGVEYDASKIRKETLSFEGFDYRLVGLSSQSAPENGLVKDGELVVRYEYVVIPKQSIEEKRGTVSVAFKDTEGHELAERLTLKNNVLVKTVTTTTTPKGTSSVDSKTGVMYNAEPAKMERITKDGFTYQFLKIKDGDVQSREVPVGETVITYLYEAIPQMTTTKEVGTVLVRFETPSGELLKELVLKDNETVNDITTIALPSGTRKIVKATEASYDASVAKEHEITRGDKLYRLRGLKDNTNESGLIPVGETVVTYIYDLVEPKKSEVSPNPPIIDLPDLHINEVPKEENTDDKVVVVPKNPPVVDLPDLNINEVPIVENADDKVVVVPNNPPVVDLPDLHINDIPKEGNPDDKVIVVPDNPPIIDLPSLHIIEVPETSQSEEKVEEIPATPPVVDLPDLEISTVPESAEPEEKVEEVPDISSTPNKSTGKIDSKPVDDSVSENKEGLRRELRSEEQTKLLPKTGSKERGLGLFGALSLILGINVFLKKDTKRKYDE